MTRAQAMPTMRDCDTELIEQLNRKIAGLYAMIDMQRFAAADRAIEYQRRDEEHRRDLDRIAAAAGLAAGESANAIAAHLEKIV